MLLFLRKLLINALDILAREMSSTRPKRPVVSLITPAPLSPTEREIIARAEQSFRELEAQSQAVLAKINANPVIIPDAQTVNPTEIPEILEVPSLLEVPEILERRNLVTEALPAMLLEQTPQGWTAIEAGVEESSPAPVAISLVELNRRSLVEGLLDEAWQQGHTTYSALMNYVKAQSGTGCSKRMIASWKKARHLEAA